jgi:hypothetical protein
MNPMQQAVCKGTTEALEWMFLLLEQLPLVVIKREYVIGELETSSTLFPFHGICEMM